MHPAGTDNGDSGLLRVLEQDAVECHSYNGNTSAFIRCCGDGADASVPLGETAQSASSDSSTMSSTGAALIAVVCVALIVRDPTVAWFLR